MFYLAFSGLGLFPVGERLNMKQLERFVARCVMSALALAMLCKSPFEIRCDAGVEATFASSGYVQIPHNGLSMNEFRCEPFDASRAFAQLLLRVVL